MKAPFHRLARILGRALCIALVAVLVLAVTPASAQTAGTLDPTFTTGISSGGAVQATAVQPDGKTIIGGIFTTVGGATHTNLARLNADGTVDATFTASANGQVTCVAVQADGKIVFGGAFTTVNGTTRNRIARLNGDGSLESTATFNPGTGANGSVSSVAVQADGKIVLGGQFTTVNGTARNSIARLNGDGSLESTTTFNPGTGADAIVVSVAVQADGKIVLGGAFTTVNGTTRNRIARLNGDGSLESTTTFDPGTGANGSVSSVAVQADGKIVLGGQFTTVNGTARNSIARLNGDGSLESTTTFNPGTGPDGSISSVAMQADGKIVLGGGFNIFNGALRIRIARLNGDGSLESTATFNAGTGASSDVSSVAVQADGKIVLGGTFTTVNGTARVGLARLLNDAAIQTLSTPDAATVRWERRGGGPAITGQVTFEQSVDGGANYTSLGAGTRVGTSETWQLTGVSLPSTGRLRARGRAASGLRNGSSGIVQQVEDFGPAGSLATTFTTAITSPMGIAGYVDAIAVQPDGKTIIGGLFTAVGGAAHTNLARLNADGSVDASFTPSTNFMVACVAVQADGKIVLGGSFDTVNGMPCKSIARLNRDGSLESTATFNPGTGANGSVFSVAVQSDGKILLGGNFTTVNGTTRNRIARLNADGSLESTATFNPGIGAESYVSSVAVQADGKIVLGGYFTTMNGTTRNHIARLNADGSLESTTTFDPGTGADSAVYCVAVQPDGKIVLGGQFTTVNGSARNCIARLNGDGSLEGTATFNPGTGANGAVTCVAVQADGKIVLGGIFTTVNGTARNRIARLNGDGSLESTATFNIGSGANSNVDCVAVQGDGKIMLGGQFTTFNGTSRGGLARLNNSAATQSLTAPDTAQVLWSRSGAGPDVSAVTFEKSTDGGSTWTALGAGIRVGTSANWQLFGLSLPTTGNLRARGRAASGSSNGGSGLIEQVNAYTTSAPTSAPAVSTPTSASVTASTATLGGNVTGDGGATIIERGVVYALTSANADPLIGGSGVAKVTASGTTGVFTVPVNGLSDARSYSFKAYASNSVGTTYTSVANVTTLDGTAPDTTITSSTPAANSTSAIITFTGTDNVAVTSFEGKLDGAAFATVTSPGSLTGLSQGAHTYSVRAKDAAGNVDATPATVTWTVDTIAPTFSLPANITAEATSASGAAVSYTASASDVGGSGVATSSFTPASGSTFALGPTTVNASATDNAGNTATASFTVTVADTTAPVVTPPANVTVVATSSAGAVVSYSPANASDAVGVVSLVYSQASGSAFPAGTTTVTVTARDAANNVGTGTFSVTVTPITAVQNWRVLFYGTTSNTGNAADIADPYHTGIQNLAVFALLGPSQDPSKANMGMLPRAQKSGGNYFFSFTQPAGVSGVTYGAEWRATFDAENWQSMTDTGSGDTHIFSVPIAGNARVFMRLTVTSL